MKLAAEEYEGNKQSGAIDEDETATARPFVRKAANENNK